MAGEHECEKEDSWEAQRERNMRYERTFEKIEMHLERQTVVMESIAKQSTQIAYMSQSIEEGKRVQEVLFSLVRKLEKKVADHELASMKADKDTFVSLKNGTFLIVVSAVVSLIVKLL